MAYQSNIAPGNRLWGIYLKVPGGEPKKLDIVSYPNTSSLTENVNDICRYLDQCEITDKSPDNYQVS